MIQILAEQTPIPPLAPVRQKFARPRENQPASAVNRELSRREIADSLQPGMRVAVAVGSRGLSGLTEIVKSLVGELKNRGCYPFIIPAMASHGGAMAEGQTAILASYGITESGVGAPVVSSMATDEIGRLPSGISIYFDRTALTADAIIPINRIKPHTAFRGEIESGLVKMLCIGLGKHKGATTYHAQGMNSFPSLLEQVGQHILTVTKVVFGLALVENAYSEIALIKAVPAKTLIEEEKGLLRKARELMGKILFSHIDVLIVDEIGKDISGEGMDPNIIRRLISQNVQNEDEPQRIVVLDLTAKTHGNAIGIGMADITTRRLWSKINLADTYTNTVTTTMLSLGRIPLIADSDRQAIQIALSTVAKVSPPEARVVRIKNTKDLEEVAISAALFSEAEGNPLVEVISGLQDLVFDQEGNIF
ncbi:MAG: nickel pincer cofactor-dependent isomerase, group 22 [Desulfitobacteriaceae bacterium]